ASFSATARGGIMLALYALGIIAAAGTAWFFKGKGPMPAFILEMPSYKLPQLSQVVRAVYTNTSEFLVKAGTTIFCLSVILWAMTYYPQLPQAQVGQITDFAEGAWRLYGQAGRGSSGIPRDEQERKRHDQFVSEMIDSQQLRQSIAGRIGH